MISPTKKAKIKAAKEYAERKAYVDSCIGNSFGLFFDANWDAAAQEYLETLLALASFVM